MEEEGGRRCQNRETGRRWQGEETQRVGQVLVATEDKDLHYYPMVDSWG
jgi:hypothetical protein